MRNLIAVILVLQTWTTFSADVVELRDPIPAADKLKAAEATIRDIFKDDLQKTSPQDQLALAANFIQQAKGTNDDPAAKYKLLEMALSMSSHNGDIDGSMRAIQRISAGFQVESGKLTLAALVELAHGAKTKEQSLALAHAYADVGESAANDDDYATAATAYVAAQTHGRNAQDVPFCSTIEKKISDVTTRKLAYENVKVAKAKLTEKPEDPDANMIVGKFLCLTRGEWDKGLPMLGKANAKWSAAALADLANPADAAGQVAVGDKWYDLGAELVKAEQSGVRARAGVWYDHALPSLTGLTRARIEKRLQESQASAPVTSSTSTAHLQLGISEATKRVLPTPDELTDLEKRLKELKNTGGKQAEREAHQFMWGLVKRFTEDDPSDWTEDDWKARQGAVQTISEIYKKATNSSISSSSLWERWDIWTCAAKTRADFLQRMKFGISNRGKVQIDKYRQAVYKYLAANSATFPTNQSKIQFCDWLKQNGVSDSGIDEYRKDLEGGNDTPNDPRSKAGKGNGGNGTTK